MTAAGTDVLPVLRALGDRTACGCGLRQKELRVRDLVECEGIPQPLLSHHLRILSDPGLVVGRRSEGFSLYAVNPEGMASARELAIELLDPDAVSPLARSGGNDACCREDVTVTGGGPMRVRSTTQ